MSLPPRAPFIRSRPVTFLASARRHVLTTWLAGAVIFAFLNAVPRAAWAYVFEGASWPAGTIVVLHLGLGDAGRTLFDVYTFWNTPAAPALNMWDQVIQRAHLTSVSSTASVA